VPTDERAGEFAERGYILVPRVVPVDVLAQAARRISDESGRTRRALYYRIGGADHASRRGEFLQDPWIDYEPIRSGRTPNR